MMTTARSMTAVLVAISAAGSGLAIASTSPAATPTPTRFRTEANATCRSFFRAVDKEDLVLERRLGAHPTQKQQVRYISRVLMTTAQLSLRTDAKLSRLSVPTTDVAVFGHALASDRAGGRYSLAAARRIAKAPTVREAQALGIRYTRRYTQLESGWIRGIKTLQLTGCQGPGSRSPSVTVSANG